MFKARFLYDTLEGRPRCHAGTIVELPSGEYLAAFYAGTFEGHPDSAILTARLANEIDGWQDVSVVVDNPGWSDGNPVLHVDDYGHVWLFYATQHNPKWNADGTRKEAGEEPIGWDSVYLYATKSEDEGRTWEHAVQMAPNQGWMVRNKAIRLDDGRTLLPCYDEQTWRGFCLISDDECLTWRQSGPMEGPCSVIQPSLFVRRDGAIEAYLRSGAPEENTDQRVLWRTISTDRGETWSPCEPTDLPNPNSAADLVRMDNGHLALLYNDSHTARTPLTLALSRDEGKTWPIRKTIESEEGEFSYPAIIQGHGGRLHMIYTYRRTHMKHVTVTELWLTGE